MLAPRLTITIIGLIAKFVCVISTSKHQNILGHLLLPLIAAVKFEIKGRHRSVILEKNLSVAVMDMESLRPFVTVVSSGRRLRCSLLIVKSIPAAAEIGRKVLVEFLTFLKYI